VICDLRLPIYDLKNVRTVRFPTSIVNRNSYIVNYPVPSGFDKSPLTGKFIA